MGRMHTHNHGKSHSIRPIELKKPDWVKMDPKEIEELIIKYAKDGMTSSKIGIKLRDQYAIPLVKPIINDNIDFVVGARKKELREPGSMTLPQRFGNWLATFLMGFIYNSEFTDLGPFRAIKYEKLLLVLLLF